MMDKTEKIVAELRNELATGKYTVGERFPSEYELAERFGVHKSTANKAVALLVEQGLLARGKRGSGTHVLRHAAFPRGHLGFVGTLNYPYPPLILGGVQRMALAKGYLVSVFAPQTEEEEECLDMLAASGIHGVIICRYGMLYRNAAFPVIHVDCDRLLDGTDLHGVDCDKYAGARMMVEEVFRRGHREIAVYAAAHNRRSASPWLCGFHDAMKEHGLDAKSRTFWAVERTEQEARRNLRAMLEAFPQLSMIVCDSDERASLIARAAFQEGIDCPGAISLSGTGNLPGVGVLGKFASIEQHPALIGSTACAELIALVEGKTPDSPIRELLKPELVNLQYIRALQ